MADSNHVVFEKLFVNEDGSFLRNNGMIMCHDGEEALAELDESTLKSMGLVCECADPPAANILTSSASSSSQESLLEAEISSNSPNQVKFPVGAVKLLLDKYAEYLPKIGPMKRFKLKKHMWEQISKDIEDILALEFSAAQCETKYKGVLKRKKNTMDNNQKSGSTRKVIDFEDEVAKIVASDDSLMPEIMRGVGKVTITPKRRIDSPQKPKKKQDNSDKKNLIAETILKVHELKEEGRERRHKEKLELLKSLFDK